jgi:hypothetical protein
MTGRRVRRFDERKQAHAESAEEEERIRGPGKRLRPLSRKACMAQPWGIG